MDTEFYQWVRVLIFLYDHQGECLSGFAIGKGTNISSTSSIVNITHMLEEKGLIKIERKGRVNKYVMTEKGKKAGEHFIKLFALLKGA